MRRAAAVALLLALAGSGRLAAEARLDVVLEPAACTIGDPVTATVTLRLDGAERDAPARLPEWGASWGDLAVLETGEAETIERGGAVEIRRRLRVAAYRTGVVEAPPVAAVVGGREVRSAPTRLTIRSVLPPGDAELEPKPPAPPRRIGLSPAFWWTTAVLAAAALVAGWRLARRRAPGVAAAPALPPLVELERALVRLAGFDPERGHAALSLALRRYLGRSCDVPAPAWSTSELARRLGRRELGDDLVQRSARLLREIDLVKFAGRPAEAPALDRRVAEAGELARAIELRLHPPAPAAPAADAPPAEAAA